MKFRIELPEEEYGAVKDYLVRHGVEIGDEADYKIMENERYPAFLSARNGKKESIRLSAGDVIFIEAFGKDIEIHTLEDTYLARERMYQLEELLNPREFLRVSKSVIISKKHVKKIRPTLSMKYILTMTGGTLVDVTRSYYNDFRRFFGI
ncbi:MAG: LytTR family transcriptional regulator [Lachnospiraceae bacterium]|nr:LytTR family transcriptional regulator [Lachnospiraceae bacterium]